MKGTLVGYLGRDPEEKIAKSGNTYVAFSVAENHYNRNTQSRETLWYNVTVTGVDAKTILQNFVKGSGIILYGFSNMPWVGDNGNVQIPFFATGFDFPPKAGNSTSAAEVSTDDDPFA